VVNLQEQLVKEYKSAYGRFRNSRWLNNSELEYIGTVYSRLFKQSLQNLDGLMTVITANRLRMSDDERLKAIDDIFLNMQQKLVFLRHFNSSTTVLTLERSREQNDVDVERGLYGIK
jgi:hypothetical protein